MHSVALGIPILQQTLECAKRLERLAVSLDMIGAGHATDLRTYTSALCHGTGDLKRPHLDELIQRIDEMLLLLATEFERRNAVIISPTYAKYYRHDAPFGEGVAEAFPDAAFDISEAGKCLALGRATAAVYHLMRSLEVSLRAVAEWVGVTEKTSNWGAYVVAIRKAPAARSEQPGADRDYYAEVAAQFSAIKNAWRNPTMHVERVHTVEQAETIYAATRTFMMLLAERPVR